MTLFASIMIKLLGGEGADDSVILEHVVVRFAKEHWVSWFILLLVVSLGVAWLLYRKSPIAVGWPRRLGLTGLRALFLALLLITFLQPIFRLTETRAVPRTLPIAIDHSQSFGVRDIGSEKTRIERGHQALETLKLTLGNELKLSTYRFGEKLASLGGRAPIKADAPTTAMGDAIDSVLSGHAGEPLAGIVLITDGNSNHGRSLEEATTGDVPLYIVGIGASETTDAALRRLQVPLTMLVADRVPVEIEIDAQGLEGEMGEVILTLDGVEVDRRPIDFTDSSQTVTLEFLPDRPGTYDLSARVETPAQEILTANNSTHERIDVIDSSIRVLMIEQAPRWEFKYLQAMLLREPRIDLKCVLFEADAAATREAGSPYLESFPRREELLSYDLVILGDVDPDILTDDYQKHLIEHVSQTSGALVIVAGKRYMPSMYRHTAIASLLPVRIESPHLGSSAASRPFKVKPVMDIPMLRLTDDPEQNAMSWQNLPPIYSKTSIAGVKPGASVLLETEAGDPLAVLQRYGSGEIFFLATDNAWRWRRHMGDRVHTRFWGQVIQRLAGSRLIEGSRRASVQTARRHYRPGDRMEIKAELRSNDWQPLTRETVIAVLKSEVGEGREIILQKVPKQPGNYAGEVMAGLPGTYQLTIPELRESRPIDLFVEESNDEFQDLTVDAGRLRRLAERTGGKFFRLEDIAELPAAIQNREAKIERTRETAFWASPLYFLILLVPLTAEWILRKFCELK